MPNCIMERVGVKVEISRKVRDLLTGLDYSIVWQLIYLFIPFIIVNNWLFTK